jgi:large conductance mechanosensitive channel
MRPILAEFREFAVKGSVIDLAVGIVIGGAFQKIVNSLVNDIIMPPIGALMGQVDFKDMFINLSSTPAASLADAKAKALPTLNYGMFINEVLTFIIVAWALFMVVKLTNKLRREKEVEEKKG